MAVKNQRTCSSILFSNKRRIISAKKYLHSASTSWVSWPNCRCSSGVTHTGRLRGLCIFLATCFLLVIYHALASYGMLEVVRILGRRKMAVARTCLRAVAQSLAALPAMFAQECFSLLPVATRYWLSINYCSLSGSFKVLSFACYFLVGRLRFDNAFEVRLLPAHL